MSCGAMDFTPLFCINRSPEWSFLLLINGLLLAVSMIAAIPMNHYVVLLIFLLVLL
jgi:hypothetical protein